MIKLAIIGFGNQAKAWALNLRDSQVNFSIGLRENSKSKENIKFNCFNYEKESADFTHFIILTPDETHFDIVSNIYSQNKESTFIYAHGHSIVSTDILKLASDASHLLLAPKSIASELRLEFELNGKIPAVYSLEYSKSKIDDEKFISMLAENIGITSLSLSNFQNETFADLFSEQTILCSAIPYLALHSFNTLIENGIDKEVAFYECFHELKSISSAFVKMGPLEFFKLISPNALIGSEVGQRMLFDATYKEKLQIIFENIKSNKFDETIKSTDLVPFRDQILARWNDTELQKTYDRLKSDLY